ncbi:hypothetical protein F4679DRAFT_328352 [Xylaria curta]|nr:hypothetical protein F4679DRAFT_328352 [Xylaria curta]
MPFSGTISISEDLSQGMPSKILRNSLQPDARYLPLTLDKKRDAYNALTSRNHVKIDRLLSLAARGAIRGDIPPPYLLETTPTQPRYYSVASLSTVSLQGLTIPVGVERKPLAEDPTVETKSLTTNYLLAIAI